MSSNFESLKSRTFKSLKGVDEDLGDKDCEGVEAEDADFDEEACEERKKHISENSR